MNGRKLFHVLGLMVLVGLAVVPAGSAQSRAGAQSNPIEASFQSVESSGSLVWNTFLGGSVDDSSANIAFDASGNMYICGDSGATWGTPIDPFAASSDAYVAKLSPSGSLVWNTFLGGNALDSCGGISLDASGNVYIAGYSAASWGTPLRAYSGGGDAFVARLNPSGGLVWNTFLGGGGNDRGDDIAVDLSGNMFIAGESYATWGTPIDPFSGLSEDIFIARLGPDGQLTWNTFISGGYLYTWVSGGMEVDTNGNLYIGATTWDSFDSEIPHELRAGFTVKLDASGVKLWGHGYGGSGSILDPAGNIVVYENLIYPDDFSPDGINISKLDGDGNLLWHLPRLGGYALLSGSDIAVDAAGNVYLLGESYRTWGTPLRPFKGGTDASLVKLNPGGALLWNTFLGGASWDAGGNIAVDVSGNVFVSGESYATWGTPRRPFAGGEKDVFVAALAGSGPLLWNTFLGGGGKDSGGSLTLEGSGSLYVTGTSNAGWGTPVRPFAGGMDVFVARLDANVPLSVRTFRSIGAQDGWVLESTEGSNAGGSLNSTAVVFHVGDDAADRQYRSILSFDTSVLPDNIVITKATLWIRRYGMAGTNPFSTHGGLKADIRKPYFGSLAGLVIGDFQAAANQMEAATFNRTPSATGWHLAVLNAAAHPYINRTGTTQFRLRFWLDDNDDLAADYLKFYSGNALTISDQPRLVVQYFVP